MKVFNRLSIIIWIQHEIISLTELWKYSTDCQLSESCTRLELSSSFLSKTQRRSNLGRLMSYFCSICRRECLSSWQSCRRLAVVTQSTWLIRRPVDCSQQLKNIAIDLLVPALFFFSFCFGLLLWLHLFCGYPFCAQSRQCDFRGENDWAERKGVWWRGVGERICQCWLSESCWGWRHWRRHCFCCHFCGILDLTHLASSLDTVLHTFFIYFMTLRCPSHLKHHASP